MKNNTYKSVVDAWNGYHAMKLVEESRNLTAFITPYGRYHYCRAPQGYVCSGDAYTHRADNITKDVTHQCKVVDDTLLFDDSISGNFYHTFDYLTTESPSMRKSSSFVKWRPSSLGSRSQLMGSNPVIRS